VRVGELKRSSTVMISGNAMTILSGGWWWHADGHGPRRRGGDRRCALMLVNAIRLWVVVFDAAVADAAAINQSVTGPPSRSLVASRIARSISDNASR
jgi:hypothetical protein